MIPISGQAFVATLFLLALFLTVLFWSTVPPYSGGYPPPPRWRDSEDEGSDE